MVRMPHWPSSKEKALIKPGLDIIQSLMSALDNPHLKIPPVIHVTGTNGKGSTIAFLKYILRNAGYKVHVYTSPHLIRFNERIEVANSEISDDLLFQVIEGTRIAAEKNNIVPTFFEGTTAAAILAFSKVPADFTIIETGLGAKLDATNIIDNPAATIICSISLDHTEYLGDNVIDIAHHKAGIIKNNTPCIVAMQYEEVFKVIEQYAHQHNASLYAFEYDWIAYKYQSGMKFESENLNLTIPLIGLNGDHQIMNAGNAIAALNSIQGLNISAENYINGIRDTFWPSRLQKLTTGTLTAKLPPKWEIIVDGAHNEAGAFNIGNWLSDLHNTKKYLIFGMSQGRDVIAFINLLKDHIDKIYVVSIDAEPLSYSAEELSLILNNNGIENIQSDSIEDSLEKIIAENDHNQQSTILACGSLYLAADIAYKNQAMRKK
jgi:dihydrofolate synthase / folylpolyglutamate synthase